MTAKSKNTEEYVNGACPVCKKKDYVMSSHPHSSDAEPAYDIVHDARPPDNERTFMRVICNTCRSFFCIEVRNHKTPNGLPQSTKVALANRAHPNYLHIDEWEVI